jgi:hypothetical protein
MPSVEELFCLVALFTSGSPIRDKLRKTEGCQGEKEKMSNCY